ncbi:MAG: penicillin-binding protein 1C [Spirochaetota bacterium]
MHIHTGARHALPPRGRLLFAVPVAVTSLLLVLWLVAVPRPLFDEPYSRVVYDRGGRLLGALIAADEQWRFPRSPHALPERYVTALVAFEDERFFRHPGVDPIAIARAAVSNLAAGEVVSGGSTITMQLARLARGNRPRTYVQKFAEASLALRLELAMSKDEVIRAFAAHAPFGGNVVGIEAASWRYFGRPAAEVTWAEAALLAVLPNSPSLMHLAQRRDELEAKRDRLLERLAQDRVIDEEELRLALSEPLPREPEPIPQVAAHLVQSLASEYPDRWRLATTIDGAIQRRVGEIVAQHGLRLRSAGAAHAAALVLDVRSGEAIAYVGNLPARDPVGPGDRVDIVRAPRSTGSLLKPLLYAAMVDSGELLPAQLVADVPTRIGGYIPENHTHQFTGAVRADEALARSLNVPAARLLRDFGVARFYGVLRDVGMTTLVRPADEYGIPLILGGAESTLWELTGIYAGMARTVLERSLDRPTFYPPHVLAGDQELPHAVGAARGRGQRSVALRSPFSPAALYLTLTALHEVERPEELSGWQYFSSAGAISWKTGTSYGLRDAWAIGVTESHAVGVWVGNASGAGAPGLRGTASAGPVMFQIFEVLGSGSGFRDPGGMRLARVCAQSGYLAGPDCAEVEHTLVPGGAHDHAICPYCETLHLDAGGEYQVDSSIYAPSAMRNERWFVLPGAMAYYYQRQATDYVAPPPFDPRIAARTNPIAVEFPLPGARVYVPVEMSGERGSIVARAHHQVADARLFWHLDGRYLGETTDEHVMELSPSAGVHELAVVDLAGSSVEVEFHVRRAVY